MTAIGFDISEFAVKLDEVATHVDFNPRRHTYTVDGAKYPSVTTLLDDLDKPALDKWKVKSERELCKRIAKKLWDGEMKPGDGDFEYWFETALGGEKEHERISREATNLGTEVHALIQWWINERLDTSPHHGRLIVPCPQVSSKAQELFGAFVTWAEATDLQPLASEVPIYNKTHRYAGRVDLFAICSGVKTIVDFKTEKTLDRRLWPEMIDQSEAYREAAQDLGLGTWAGLIIKLPKDGTPVTPILVGDNPGRRKGFLALVARHWALEETS